MYGLQTIRFAGRNRRHLQINKKTRYICISILFNPSHLLAGSSKNKFYTVQKIKLYCDYGTLIVCRFHFVFKFYEVASYQNIVILAVIREAVYHFLSSQSNLNDSAVEIVHIFPFHRSV